MFKHIDWLLIVGYFKSYAICLISLLSLYIVVDLFLHLDDFFNNNTKGIGVVAIRVWYYYAYRIPQLFDRLCEAIVLLAAMFTVAMMQRNNEAIPLLSSGVSMQRIVMPVLVCSAFTLGLSILNQEMVIPKIGDQLTRDRNDPGGEREIHARSSYEPNLIHIEGDKAIRHERLIRGFRCVIPENVANQLVHITADEARYYASEEPGRGLWKLTGCHPTNIDPIPGILDKEDTGRYILHTRSVDFDAMTRDPRWYTLASTRRLFQELQRPENTRLAAMAVLFHTRLTRPFLGLVLVFLGLSVILRDQNRNVIISAGMCLVLCGMFFATVHACKMMGDNEYLNPAMAAWLPILLYGPFALVMFDAVQT